MEAIELMGSRRNRCRLCGKSFSTDIALRRHLKERHRGYYYGIRLGPFIAIAAILLAVLLAPHSGTALTAITPSTPTTSIVQTRSSQKEVAPDFELPEIDELGLTDKKIKLSQFSGKPVLIEFMFPICDHCIKMTPTIKELYEKYGDRVVFISITVKWYLTDQQLVKLTADLIKKYERRWLHLGDMDGKAQTSYRIRATPTYILLDSKHRVVWKHEGELPKDYLERAILEVIG